MPHLDRLMNGASTWRAAGSWLLAGALALLVGSHVLACSKRDPAASPPPSKEEVATKGAEAARAVRDYTFAQKDELVQRMSAELVTIRATLDELNGKVERGGDAASAEAKAKLVVVREQWDKTQAQLELARNANAENWNELKAAFSSSVDELKSSFQSARQWVDTRIGA